MRVFLFLVFTIPFSVSVIAAPLGTQFTYQGELRDTGITPNGDYDFEFEVFDDPGSGSSLANPVTQTLTLEEGIFTALLDFGDAPFTGDAVWLEVRVRPAGEIDYTTLTPRQPITSTPYALHAQFVGIDAVSSAEIQDGSIQGSDLAPSAIGSAQIDSTQVQRRVSGNCAVGQFIRAVAPDGTVTCDTDQAGDNNWLPLGDGRIQSTAGVRIQPDPAAMFPFTVRHDSAIDSPHLALTESEPNDYTRMSFYNDADQGRFWTVAASITGDVNLDRFNIYNSGVGGSGADILSIMGNGRVGINYPTPASALSVRSEGNFGPGIGDGRGDFFVGNSTLGLSIGVALGGGGAGTSRIWTNTQGAIVLANTSQDVMSVGFNGDRVGIGTNQPLQRLHISGGDVRIDNLSHAGPENRPVEVGPDGDLVLQAPRTGSVVVGGVAFQPLTEGIVYRVDSGTFKVISGSEGDRVGAPVQLPVGATVTSVTATLIDNAAAVDMVADLTAIPRSGGANLSLASIVTSGSDPLIREFTDSSITNPVVLEDYFYQVGAVPQLLGWSSAYQIRAFKITYTY